MCFALAKFVSHVSILTRKSVQSGRTGWRWDCFLQAPCPLVASAQLLLLQALLCLREISGLCLSEWSVFGPGCWVLHLTHPPVSSRGPLPTSGIFKVLCPAEVPCAWRPGSWTPRCMGHDEPCKFVPHQGMVVEGPRDRPYLTGGVGARDTPPSCFPLGLSSWALHFCMLSAATPS